ncbi:MAG TPA: transglutaminase domain-containing protein, partial [Propionibacterium sp.]|nr:transglutaminase domain-containing protein [Propionibacterium sp.]
MRVVAPRRAETSTASAFTGTLQLLRPSRADLVDALFVVGLGLVALAAWASSFSTGSPLVVGALGLLLGVLAAHVTTALRWPWVTAVGIVVVLYALLGGAVALRDDLVVGFVPSLTTLRGLAGAAVGGWKDLLTTLPPVPGDSEFLVLPWLVGLAFGSGAHLLARRTRSAWGPPALAAGLLAALILLGTFEAAAPVLVGVLGTAGTFVWLFVRHTRRRSLGGTGLGRSTRWVAGGVLLALALAGGVGAAQLMPGPERTPRTVLRTWVQPPLDVDRYPSPLAGFRKYSSDSQALYDQPLLRVEGAAPGSLLRMAVLDDWDGLAWSASGGVAGDPRTGFQRIGARIPGTPTGQTTTVRLTIEPAFAATRELAVWLPAPGPATEIQFTGPNARAHGDVVRYNIGTGQGLVPDFLKAGDTIEVTSVALPADTGQLPQASGPVLVRETVSAPLVPTFESMAAAAGDPWSRAQEVARVLREDGAWSNGTKPGQQQYLPGHGLKRLLTFGTELVGSDEHYAATYALALNRLGYPARVVMGAPVPADGVVKGQHVQAWVEVSLAGQGWVTIPTEAFTPDRNKEPTNVPPKTLEQQNAPHVPPPNPVRPPGSFDSLFNTHGVGDQLERPAQQVDWWKVILGVVRVVGPPIGAILAVVGLLLGAKALRRYRRRTRGPASTRVAGGWLEFLDRARDLGRPVPAQ